MDNQYYISFIFIISIHYTLQEVSGDYVKFFLNLC